MFDDLYENVNRSSLYNLEPIGIGTARIESLSGYISRLATLHSITTGDFISKILNPILKKTYLSNIAKKGGDGFYKSSNGINGIGSLAQDFTSVLEELTYRKDLKETTLLRWQQVFPTRGLLKSERAWCPICYSEDLENNKNIYDRLIWNFQIVNICTIHNQYLLNVCPNCKKRNPVINRKSRPGFCSICDSWLGEKQYSQDELMISAEDISFENMVREILCILNDNQENLYRGQISEALKYYTEEYFYGEISKVCKTMNIPKSTFESWYSGERMPQIKSVLQICLYLGIGFQDFLNLKEIKLTKILPPVEKFQNRHVSKRHDHKKIQEILKEVIINKSPFSIKKLAEIIGCDRKLLSRKYPLECKQIKDINDEHINLTKQNRNNQKLQMVEDAFNTLLIAKEYPSRRRMENLLGDGVLQEKLLKNKWKSLKKTIVNNLD